MHAVHVLLGLGRASRYVFCGNARSHLGPRGLAGNRGWLQGAEIGNRGPVRRALRPRRKLRGTVVAADCCCRSRIRRGGRLRASRRNCRHSEGRSHGSKQQDDRGHDGGQPPECLARPVVTEVAKHRHRCGDRRLIPCRARPQAACVPRRVRLPARSLGAPDGPGLLARPWPCTSSCWRLHSPLRSPERRETRAAVTEGTDGGPRPAEQASDLSGREIWQVEYGNPRQVPESGHVVGIHACVHDV